METAVSTAFGDGEYRFWLPMARVVAVEREGECSIFQLFHDLGDHLGKVAGETVLAGPSPAKLKQCHSLIRHALVGGDEVNETQAREMVETYCYPARPAIYDLALAWTILHAAVYGIELKKKRNEADEPMSGSTKDA